MPADNLFLGVAKLTADQARAYGAMREKDTRENAELAA